MESFEDFLSEGKKLQIKRRYTENHPAHTVGKTANVRNAVLKAVADGVITEDEFVKILSELSGDHKQWRTRNKKYFFVSEEGIKLSKWGMRILNELDSDEEEMILSDEISENFKILKDKWPYIEVKSKGKKYEIEFDDYDVIDDHGNEGKDLYFMGTDQNGDMWEIDVYADYRDEVQDIHYDTLVQVDEYFLSEARAPKNWDSMFTMKAIEAYKNGEFDLEDDKSIAEWDKEYNGGRAPKPAFNTKEVVSYAIDTGKKPNGDKMDESVMNEKKGAPWPEQLKQGLTHWGHKKGSHTRELKTLPCRIGRNAQDFGGPNHAQELADLNMKDPMVKKFFKPKFKNRADGNYVNDHVELIPKRGYLYKLFVGTGGFEYFCLAIKPGEVYIFRKYDQAYNQYEYFQHEGDMSTRSGVFDFKRHREEEQWKWNKQEPESASHIVKVGWGIMDIGLEYTQLELPFENLKTNMKKENINEAKELSVGDKGVDYNDNVVEVIAIGKYRQIAKMFKKEMKADAEDYGFEETVKGDYYLTKNIEATEGNVGDFAIYPVKYDFDMYWGLDPLKESFNLFESFGDFLSSNGILNEAINSAILRSVLSNGREGKQAKKNLSQLAKGFYGLSKVALDKIEDEDFIVSNDVSKVFKNYGGSSHILFFISDNEKENPYYDTKNSSWNDYKIVPGGGIVLAAMSGDRQFYANEWSRWSGGRVWSKNKKGDEEQIGINHKYRGWGASGLNNGKRIAEMSDRVIVINLELIRQKYSTENLRNARNAARAGATAFKSDKDFKTANLDRYHKILADKAASLPLDKMVKDAIELLSKQLSDGISSGSMTKYDEIKVGEDPKGREVKARDCSNHISNILDDYSRYVSYIKQGEESESRYGQRESYYEKESKNYAKRIKDKIAKIEKFDYAW